MRRAFAAAAVSACLVVAGCGDSEEGATGDTIAAPPSSTTTTSTFTVERCEGEECPTGIKRSIAKATMENYFNAVEAGAFGVAWNLLDPDVKEQFGGFDTWRSGIEQRESTELVSLEPLDSDAFDVVVRTAETTPCGVTADRTFSGTWTVDPDTGLIASAEQILVSGPPDLEVLCATGGY